MLFPKFDDSVTASHKWSLNEEHPALTRTVCLAFSDGQMSASNDTPTWADAAP